MEIVNYYGYYIWTYYGTYYLCFIYIFNLICFIKLIFDEKFSGAFYLFV